MPSIIGVIRALLRSGRYRGYPLEVLLIANHPPYGTERSYNALRPALALAKDDRATNRLMTASRNLRITLGTGSTPR